VKTNITWELSLCFGDVTISPARRIMPETKIPNSPTLGIVSQMLGEVEDQFFEVISKAWGG